MHEKNQNIHIPVLLDAVLEYLVPQPGETYLDATAGYGGHARAIVEQTKATELITLIDRDDNAVNALQPLVAQGAHLLHADFYSASKQLLTQAMRYDMILADLGISSPHIDNAERGFAFGLDGPLDMRMDRRQELSAEVIVNTYGEDELTQIIRTHGEEPRARTIARAIVSARPLHTTQELAETIRAVMPKGSKTHPATRTFQALRIAVNDELELVRSSIPLWFELLKPGGRLVVISFHSLEDRIVKQAFAERTGNRYDAEANLLTKHPVTADHTELFSNPRARSAKLRAAVKK